MHQQLLTKEKTLAVIGLGYVGLPIALAFAKKIRVIGFDINAERVDMMKNRLDPSNELEPTAFDGCDIQFTHSIDDLKSASFYIVAVPTPVDKHKVPDLTPVLSASRTVGKVLSKGDIVVYESTVYPGCTEDDCIPVLEEVSGLRWMDDFKVGYSPERINPGDKNHTLENIVKVVSGSDEESLNVIATMYEQVVDAGVHRAPTIKVAEAAKIIENTQRDLNIALMNELSKIFDLMDINTYDVLEAANTKWNFLNFFPGLVGGHCIGVDPYYLTYKAMSKGYKPEVILAGRRINDSMGAYVAKKLVQSLIKNGKDVSESKVLIMGATFKEDVSDIRNTKVVDVIKELIDYSVTIDVVDAYADPSEMKHEYGLSLSSETNPPYDAIIVAVNHDQYAQMTLDNYRSLMGNDPILFDIKGMLKDRDMTGIHYWSL
ncbi:MAG: UDP-N-acetyl-D-galactosamine dehydrogenase [Saprospirales bacterium]|nr:UDP-N-acetyl-D-galactosamine dehydrogenase [Saprospirales bacterium]|tara:strand:- start:10 stop:1302 length:1293 start_codon:yes stop_codon:yes gene_type:complete